jgi:hypothetical protein
MTRARRNLSRAMHQTGDRIGRASLPWTLVEGSDARPPTPSPAARGMFPQDAKQRARSAGPRLLEELTTTFPASRWDAMLPRAVAPTH